MERVGGRQEKMEGHCSMGQSPQWAVVPMEEEEVWGSNPGSGKLLHAVLTSPEIHPASRTMGTRSFQRIKQPEHCANQSPPSSIAWVGAIPLPPLCTYIVTSLGDLYKVKSGKWPCKFTQIPTVVILLDWRGKLRI